MTRRQDKPNARLPRIISSWTSRCGSRSLSRPRAALKIQISPKQKMWSQIHAVQHCGSAFANSVNSLRRHRCFLFLGHFSPDFHGF